MPKRIHFLTGIRSEYDILAPVIKAVAQSPGLEVGVIVTGGHLTPRFGNSVAQIEADGFPITARIDTLLASDGYTGRVKGAALQMLGMADLFARQRPDFLVVMGDREESITGAISAAYHHIPVVHLGGGDHAEDGNIDNPIRHAVSKIAHLHMATTELSAQRLRSIGEEDWRIHVVGASGLDRLFTAPSLSRGALDQALGVDWRGAPYVVFLFHPTITDFRRVSEHMSAIVAALDASQLNVAAIMPNSDPGNDGVVAALTEFARKSKRVKLFSFLERTVFVNLLRHAKAMVGNSSSGILEAPSLHLPVVNIGLRQTGREHAENVIFTGYAPEEISQALTRATQDDGFRSLVAKCKSPYGDGQASARIAKIIAATKIDEKLMHKRFLLKG